ncbi:LacI family DNA-binding transcriptional regulator [Dictyobacter kobayashii]|uniref:LacI family transcriptional regulator n=1 Tax=Dictyobacter kobayashii TaxID=2014872 RepID=A0A402AU79_9CHLR|nr:LacI family DNA-binding transcriptional regulator [Dictyobacter kobayashii]GCE22661.1 LacI family transcriptional regulator [Dictyobacter kobayashii]
MATKLTIDDIARLAGVSKATVSRAMNGKPDVDPATRERILSIVEKEGFKPSATAVGLAGRSHLISVLIPSMASETYIFDILRGVADVVTEAGYELVLYSVNENAQDNNRNTVIDRILTSKLSAALLAILPGQLGGHIAQLYKPDFPIVMIDDSEPPSDKMPWVGVRNSEGARKAVFHLYSLGHRRIAHVTGPLQRLCSRERLEGYRSALADLGLEYDPALVVSGEFSAPSGHAAALPLFNLPADQRPTAIFAANDFMAYGIIDAAHSYHLRIPEDIALIGFDDTSSSVHMQPSLTTVRQPFYELGQTGCQLLFSLLEQSRSGRFQAYGKSFSSFATMHAKDFKQVAAMPAHIYLDTELMVRKSCGADLPVR